MEKSPAGIDKIEILTKQLKGMGKIALAFSGGVDSTFLLAASRA
jgi:PP-loop superfamily ATP-utilizing enzyme